MSRIVTIDAPIGGLGDALLFSTLPQMYREHGATAVFVTPRTLKNCRNPEVAELLYHRNPYLSRPIECEADEADTVAGITHEREFFFQARNERSPIECIENLHGFVPKHDRPVLYYTPRKPHIEWHTYAVIDPYSISQHFPDEAIERFARRILDREYSYFDLDYGNNVVILESKFHKGRTVLPRLPRYCAQDIYEYIDIVASAGMFLCTESGSQSIAAAVRDEKTYALCTTAHMNARLYVWPNVIYNVTGKLSEDYLWNDLTAEGVVPRW